MKGLQFICSLLVMMLFSTVIHSDPVVINSEIDLFLKPGNDELWCISVQEGTLRIYNSSSLEVIGSRLINGNPIALAFDSNGDYVYISVNVPDENRSYIACFETDGFVLNSEYPLMGIAGPVLILDNGYVIVTSQDPLGGGYIEKFSPLSLEHLATENTQEFPFAICSSSLNGCIYVGSISEFDGNGLTEPEVYSKIIVLNSSDLSKVGEIHAGLHHNQFNSLDSLLIIQNFGCASYDPGYEYLLKGLTIIDIATENILLDWQVFPNVMRGSCINSTNNKWFGCTFSSQELTGSELWMICNLENPFPVSIGQFPNSRIIRMVAYPIGTDQIRLVGIDSQSPDLFVYDVPANTPPEAYFLPFPPAGPAPLTVIFMNRSSDCDGDIVEIRCDWNGDSQTDEIIQGNPQTIVHEFTDPGFYSVILTVYDDQGANADWEGTIIAMI